MTSQQDIDDIQDEFYGEADDFEEVLTGMAKEIRRLRDREEFLTAELTMIRRAVTRVLSFFDRHTCREFQDPDVRAAFKLRIADLKRNA